MTVLAIPSRALAPAATRRRVRMRPAAEPTRMTRYRGGTYSHTADKIVFTDGTTARTVKPGTDFHLRHAPDTAGIRMAATTSHHLTGRVLTGVALAGPSHRLTPVAVTTPTHMTIEFDTTWQSDEACYRHR